MLLYKARKNPDDPYAWPPCATPEVYTNCEHKTCFFEPITADIDILRSGTTQNCCCVTIRNPDGSPVLDKDGRSHGGLACGGDCPGSFSSYLRIYGTLGDMEDVAPFTELECSTQTRYEAARQWYVAQKYTIFMFREGWCNNNGTLDCQSVCMCPYVIDFQPQFKGTLQYSDYQFGQMRTISCTDFYYNYGGFIQKTVNTALCEVTQLCGPCCFCENAGITCDLSNTDDSSGLIIDERCSTYDCASYYYTFDCKGTETSTAPCNVSCDYGNDNGCMQSTFSEQNIHLRWGFKLLRDCADTGDDTGD